MQSGRLFEILYILLERGGATVGELAAQRGIRAHHPPRY